MAISIGQKINKLTIISTDETFRLKPSGQKVYFILCRCECGKEKDIRKHQLLTSQIQSCGCFRIKNIEDKAKQIIGKRFGKLKITKFLRKSKTNKIFECLCDCGKISEKMLCNLVGGKSTSCGKCNGIFEKGQRASKVQIKIRNLLGKGVINFKVNKLAIDIAMVYKGKKIAIEYDCWQWHKKKIDRDKKREKFLIEKGWKILSIKTNNIFPNITDIWNKIEKLSTNSNYEELISEDWGK